MSLVEENYRKQDELRRKKVVRWFCYACMAANIISALPDLYYGLWINIAITLIVAAFFTIMTIINARYSTNITANLLLFIGNLIVFIFANLLGRTANVHIILVIGVLFVPFMLDIRNRFSVVFHATFPFLLLLILEIADFNCLPKLADVTEEHRIIFGYFNIIIMFFISPAVIYSIIKTQTSTYDMLLKSGDEAQVKNIALAKANTELDRFVYSVSHDLRSPIASMLGLVNLSKIEQDLTMLRHYEELKEKSLLKLDSFIRDILDYSRNTRTELKAEIIDWQLFISQHIEQHQHSKEAQAIEITFQIEQNQDFYTDLYRVSIIFNNLLSNAIRYSNILVEKQTIHINILTENNSTQIEVIDNGIGIGEEHLDNIFKMFYRASSDSKGSGLGLYIVAETIQKLNGTVSVSSQIGKGTSFSITLPNCN
ncbi:MAG: sensor histidine kinase [Cytophagales bacterium]|nr:MAG: sensor histidine kinase [Cytophagales bacterium]